MDIPSQPATHNALQCGVDLMEIDRIEAAIRRWGERFLHRVWTDGELDYCRGRYPQLASRFAAKEAASKALGTGVQGLITWRDFEVVTDPDGKPILHLHGGAKEHAELQLGLTTWSVSLTHTSAVACAFVVATR